MAGDQGFGQQFGVWGVCSSFGFRFWDNTFRVSETSFGFLMAGDLGFSCMLRVPTACCEFQLHYRCAHRVSRDNSHGFLTALSMHRWV